MDVMTAVLTRRSEHTLCEPAPTDDEFTQLLATAAHAPDHGRLRPWRWILLRDRARERLGTALAADAPDHRRDQSAAKALRAPLLATLVFTPSSGHKVREWEQLASTGAVAQSLMLLLHSRGFGSIWRTGTAVESAAVRSLLGLTDSEQLLGWLYVGTPDGQGGSIRRPLADVGNRVSVLAQAPSR
ncbi:nitroreductase [Streptacidiphilus sp. MAP12-33]|uniref:nitroreductase family protein n=1 Tax=Streptacidiphilus sp. MAP12-33 TaxID=3156266 RepID=UPI0035194A42